ncbi:MAG: hypothetical protein KKA67_15665, partial [Spirochaetes bacterium]|nr:hypothetical protein [Spirochaetota bacterium]
MLVVRVGRGEPRVGRDDGGLGRADAVGGAAGPPAPGRYRTSDEALARDREVRGHESAHLSALGPYAASGVIYDTAR